MPRKAFQECKVASPVVSTVRKQKWSVGSQLILFFLLVQNPHFWNSVTHSKWVSLVFKPPWKHLHRHANHCFLNASKANQVDNEIKHHCANKNFYLSVHQTTFLSQSVFTFYCQSLWSTGTSKCDPTPKCHLFKSQEKDGENSQKPFQFQDKQ